MISPSRLFLFP